MSTLLTMPKLEMSMQEGNLAEWLVPHGAEVTEGQVIYLLETDKTTREVEAPASGILVHKVVDKEVYACGTEIGEIM
jgi:pyruvate/2-oxoglutarate dehydrogenase complex dihydrolipoamide acyltransferase (E2) component